MKRPLFPSFLPKRSRASTSAERTRAFDPNKTTTLPYPSGSPQTSITFGGLRRDWRLICHVTGSLSLLAAMLLTFALWRPSAPRHTILSLETRQPTRASQTLAASAAMTSLPAPAPLTATSPYDRTVPAARFPSLDMSAYEVAPAAPLPSVSR